MTRSTRPLTAEMKLMRIYLPHYIDMFTSSEAIHLASVLAIGYLGMLKITSESHVKIWACTLTLVVTFKFCDTIHSRE